MTEPAARRFRTPTPRTLIALSLAAFVLFLAFVSAATVYIYVLYGGVVSRKSLIEAGHYAMQTVTTVGYGNWEVPASGVPFDPEAVLTMRAWSILFMGLGSVTFAVFVGVVVAILIPPESYTGN